MEHETETPAEIAERLKNIIKNMNKEKKIKLFKVFRYINGI